jgi:predicted DsbA family dithiol-disulfide isomerase
MFWDMHHLLFKNQSALSPEKLPGYAEELGLDVAAFQKCLSSGKHAPGIREDMRTAQTLGIGSTPMYLLGRRISGGDKVQILDSIKGAQKYEVFEEKINALLASE